MTHDQHARARTAQPARPPLTASPLPPQVVRDSSCLVGKYSDEELPAQLRAGAEMREAHQAQFIAIEGQLQDVMASLAKAGGLDLKPEFTRPFIRPDKCGLLNYDPGLALEPSHS